MTKFLATAFFLTATGSALAHPGHADQSIHLAEWLMGAGVVAATLIAARHLMRKARNKR